jgi:hypothetical protein
MKGDVDTGAVLREQEGGADGDAFSGWLRRGPCGVSSLIAASILDAYSVVATSNGSKATTYGASQ